jgi:hypothetical protein
MIMHQRYITRLRDYDRAAGVGKSEKFGLFLRKVRLAKYKFLNFPILLLREGIWKVFSETCNSNMADK